MTALLRAPPSPFPPVVIKMREDWGGCPLLVLSPRMHLNSYWQLLTAGIGWPSEWRPPAEQQLINSLIFPQSANEVIKIKVMQKEGGSQQQLLDTRRLYLTHSSRPESRPPSPCVQEREELTEPLNSFDVLFFICLFCFFHFEIQFSKMFCCPVFTLLRKNIFDPEYFRSWSWFWTPAKLNWRFNDCLFILKIFLKLERWEFFF